MRELIGEALLRFVKPLLAAALGLVVWLVLTGPGGAQGSPTLGLLCWLASAAFILLAQEGVI